MLKFEGVTKFGIGFFVQRQRAEIFDTFPE